MKACVLLIEEPLPRDAQKHVGLKCYQVPVVWDESAREKLKIMFPRAMELEEWLAKNTGEVLLRSFLPGVSNPVAQTLAGVLELDESKVRVDGWVVSQDKIPSTLQEGLKFSWREPAIEQHKVLKASDVVSYYEKNSEARERSDDSFETGDPKTWDLEFEPDERTVLLDYEKKQGRAFTRAEWEVFAQTWSEHCKHKIFGAEVEATGAGTATFIKGLFSTYIRKPALKIAEKNPGRFLSLFHDNSGAIALDDVNGEATTYSVCAKMETHNSPSAISPYGGASTGLVGVHRDIMGTGRGALPIANWNVLCFEEPDHSKGRPANALSPETIRSGVLRGIEDGGNQSGIPTVQGSVVFDAGYAVKPLVYAGSIGLLPKSFVDKKPAVGQKLYCFGGAVGADGLRGAVMSSRAIRLDDFSGSMVQVTNAFVQRRVTDFLMEARDLGLVDVVTDNGAGGLASSVGEMATLTGGATIDVSKLRLKFSNLLPWERLLSESQERMTVGTHSPEKLEALAKKWEIPFDRLGELNNSGNFEVNFGNKSMVKIPLSLLFDGCPRLKLKTKWNLKQDRSFVENSEACLNATEPNLMKDFPEMLKSPHLCSRLKIVRRFDHEVQGRNRRLPFAGLAQAAPQDGSIVECYEVESTDSYLKNKANVVLSHGLAPWRKDITENVVSSFDEALRQIVLAGGQWGSLAALDNFCWPDPLTHEQRLWWLVRANEIISMLAELYEIPFVSGKDSMKNNSKDFAIPPTLVVSIFGSGISALKVPAGFWARPNDVIYWLRPENLSLRDSTWERSLKTKAQTGREPWFEAETAAEQNELILETAKKLKTRYQALSQVISKGLIRSAKDISEGGLVTALFEMGLGRNLGCDLTLDSKNSLELLGEGLGGFAFSVDPHFTKDVEAALPEAKRLGVVIRYDALRFLDKTLLQVSMLKKDYESTGEEGFWS